MMILVCVLFKLGAAPAMIDALGPQPWRMVLGSVVFGLSLAEWDHPENRTTKEQLISIMQAVIRQSTSQLITFAWLCSEAQFLEFLPAVRSFANCGAEAFYAAYPEAHQQSGLFYSNA